MQRGHRLTNDAYLDYAPDWSPDGLKIAYRSDRDGESDIYVINVDGSGETRLTDDPAYDWAPQWSPDEDILPSRRTGTATLRSTAWRRTAPTRST